MLLVAHSIQLATARNNNDVGYFLRSHSNVGVYMPLFFNLRLVVITCLLFVYITTENTFAAYILLGTQAIYLFYVIIGRPHKKLLDYGRSICI